MSDPQNHSFHAPPPPPSLPTPAQRPTKLRIAGIVVFILGLIVAVGGLAKFIPSGIGGGGALCAMGVILFAFGFIPLPQVDSAEGPMSPPAKLTGIFFEPSRVFRNLRAYPRWIAAYLVVCVLTVVYSAAFVQRLTPERIVNFTIDKVAESGFVPADRVEQVREQQLDQAKNPIARVLTVARSFVVVFVFYSFLAGLLLLGILAFGGRINYWQSFAAVVYASVPVTVIQKVLSLIILYVKSPDDIHPILNAETLVQDNLGALVTPATHPVLFVAATSIGLLSFYRIWLTARGLQLAGTKVSSTAAWSVTVILFILAMITGMIFAALFSSFLS
ncbi:MAG: YIP1 family protein [Pyrinomonadaceae bacterium]